MSGLFIKAIGRWYFVHNGNEVVGKFSTMALAQTMINQIKEQQCNN